MTVVFKNDSEMEKRLNHLFKQLDIKFPIDVQSLQKHQLKRIEEHISCESQHLADQKKGPTGLIELLIKKNLSIFCALAAERHHHASLVNIIEQQRNFLIQSSPIVQIDKRTLFIAPVGELGQDGLKLFIDRVLAVILRSKIKRIIISTSGLIGKTSDANLAYSLKQELSIQNITIENL